MVGVCFAQVLQERLQTKAVHARQVHAEALPAYRIYSRVEVGPLVGAPHDPGRAKTPRTIPPPVPVDKPEARLVQGQDLQRLLAGGGGVAPLAPCAPLLGELFLKASCSCVSAFSRRGRPVFSFTFRRRRRPPTLSG